MKPLVWLGIVLLIVGLASFFVSLPEKHEEGIRVGDAKIGVSATEHHKLPMWVGGVLVVGGIVMMVAGGRGRA